MIFWWRKHQISILAVPPAQGTKPPIRTWSTESGRDCLTPRRDPYRSAELAINTRAVGSSRRLDERIELFKESADHHPRRCIDKTLADSGNGAAGVDVPLIGDKCSGWIRGGQSEFALPVQESDTPRSFDAQAVTRGRHEFVHDDLARGVSTERGQRDRGFVRHQACRLMRLRPAD